MYIPCYFNYASENKQKKIGGGMKSPDKQQMNTTKHKRFAGSPKKYTHIVSQWCQKTYSFWQCNIKFIVSMLFTWTNVTWTYITVTVVL